MWTELLRLEVPGVPVAQPRQRHTVIKAKDGREFNHNYTPADAPVQAFKAAIKWGVRGLAWIDGPVAVECQCYLLRPNRLMRKGDPDGPIPHTARPDWENVYKAVLDALTGVILRDDSLVYSPGPNSGKWYCEKHGAPRCVIRVLEWSA